MRPLIGVTVYHYLRNNLPGLFVGQDYTEGIYEAGGLPMALPLTASQEAVDDMAAQLDGLLLTGGEDIAPQMFGEEPRLGLGEVSPVRDRMEQLLLERMLQLDKPVFAICRGLQVLNAAMGGTLYQDLLREWDSDMQHAQNAPRNHLAHIVDIVPGTLLQRVCGERELATNTFHHQAARDVAPGYVVSARSRDGLIEALEDPARAFVLAVQWHPENLWRENPAHRRLFTAFVDAARVRQQASD